MSMVLLIDDDASLLEVLSFTLREEGHDVRAYTDARNALARLAEDPPDVVITDLKMPGVDGLTILDRVRQTDASIPVIILTAFGSIEDAVAAMKRGAHDYLTKPFSRDELKLTVEKAAERRRLLRENKDLRERLREQTRRFEFVHASEASSQLLETVKRIAPTDATVLITGESGTGKEVIAQALHALSDRWDRPFVAINCAAIPRDLMESELFGHARGAFTGAVADKPGKFQRADKGTLFLDEIGDLNPDLQTKLLRVIETRQVDIVGGSKPIQVDVRLVAATNTDLAAGVKEGRFRGDLYYRLSVIPIHIPPLRERPDDIPALWDHFVKKYADGAVIRSTPELIRALMRRGWPGNVRELANLCQQMILLRSTDTLDASGMPPSEESSIGPVGSGPHGIIGDLPDGHLSLLGLEREVIVRALAKHGGNRTRTAEYLGIPRHVLIYRLEKYGID
jgi:DNA-binding NtrC family response regulator